MASCFPHASRSPYIPSMLPSVVATCFWLVVVFLSTNWRPINPTVYFIFIIFVLVPNDGTAFPHALRPPTPPLQIPFHR